MWNYYGGTGKGVGVAVVDTGIAGDLPDFRISSYDKSSRVIGSAVVHPDATTATDRYGHGTHVAGIIAGDSSSRSYGDPLKGKYSGVAPDANRVSIKASDDDGNSTVLDVIAGIQFARGRGRLVRQPGPDPEQLPRPGPGRDRRLALELEPLLLERRRRAAAVELEPLELVHELEQVAPVERMSIPGAAPDPRRRYPG